MVFPQTNLGAKVQLQIAGVWTDATRYDAQTRVLAEEGIVITRGKASAQDRTPASTCTWTWLDPNGIYNNENPRSPYFGLLGRNTPVRVIVPRPNVAFIARDRFDGSIPGLNTPDKAALQITGDLDIRIEIEPRFWSRIAGSNPQQTSQLIASKFLGTSNGSWYVHLLDTGQIGLVWANTTTTVRSVSSTVPVPAGIPRMAIRIQFQPDNGASGNTVTFATAPSINGSYTTLGTPVVTAGTVPLLAGTSADIELGSWKNNAAQSSASLANYVGRIYAFQLRNGLNGTLVANADLTAQANGTTTFVDSTANTWTLVGSGAEISNNDYRFTGELSAPVITPNVTRNGVGADVKVHVEAGGIIRRFSQNATPLTSTLYRSLNLYSPEGYWPGEDDSSNSITASSAISGGRAASISDITFSGFDPALPGSAGVMTLGGTGPLFNGLASPVIRTNTEYHFFAAFRFPTIPLSKQTLFTVYGNGTVKRWEFAVDATNYTLAGFDAVGTQTVTKTFGFVGVDPTNWVGLHFSATQSGGNVNIGFNIIAYTAASLTSGGFFSVDASATGTTSVAGTVGGFTRLLIQGVAALSGVKVAHLMFTPAAVSFSAAAFFQWMVGYAGETADARHKRISAENGLYYTYTGRSQDTNNMGPQPVSSFMDIMYEAPDVDSGILSEERDQNVLNYRSRNSLQYQTADTVLSYTVGKHLSGNLQSTPDDTGIANDVTLSRKDGGSARATVTSGPMSIQAPPNGIGLVPNAPTINNFIDSDLPALAQYAVGVSSWPEARYPKVKVSLHRSEFTYGSSLFMAITRLDQGSRLDIKNLPLFMPAEPVTLIVQGMTETIGAMTWDFEFNTTPYGPYKVAYMNTAVTGDRFRVDSTRDSSYVCQTQLAAAATSTATSLSIKTLSGALVSVDSLDYPQDVFIGGERITISSVTGSSSPQTATVIRSINGIVKAQPINAPISTANPVNVSQ